MTPAVMMEAEVEIFKYLVTERSQNPITGPILVTTSVRATCPATCSHKGSTCYAEKGALGGFLWTKLETTPIGHAFANGIVVRNVFNLAQMIRNLPEGAVWRHNQAGDLPTAFGVIIQAHLDILVAANVGRLGFSYTHHDVVGNLENRKIITALNSQGFTVNLSADNLVHADVLYDTGCGPVAAIVSATNRTNMLTPKGRKVVICPAYTRPGTTCSSCKLCARQRDFIIGLPEQG